MQQTTEQNFEVAQTILEQLRASKINGFPFFAYTGIRDFTMTEDGELLLRKVPSNPGKVDSIWIIYNYGLDLYSMRFSYKNGTEKSMGEIFFDQMAEIIGQEMKVL